MLEWAVICLNFMNALKCCWYNFPSFLLSTDEKIWKNLRLLKIKIFSKQKFFSALKSCRVASFSIFSRKLLKRIIKKISFDRCSNNISMIPNFWISVKEEAAAAAALIRCHQRSFIAPEGFFHKNVEGRPKNNHFSSMDDFSSDQKLTSKAELKKNLSSE